jgi:hypothetical protein
VIFGAALCLGTDDRRAEVGLKGTAGSGFDGKIVLGVNPKASPAAV